MLRSIVGWNRVAHEHWNETMNCMKLLREEVLKQCRVENVDNKIGQTPASFCILFPPKLLSPIAGRGTSAPGIRKPRAQRTLHFVTLCPSRRPAGRPLTRWDDGLRLFCKRHFTNAPCWTNMATGTAWKHKAREIVGVF